MYTGRVVPEEAPMGVDTINNFISKVGMEVDQKVKKGRSKRPKKCPYDYTRILNISKTLGWAGADRLYMGYTWTGIIKLILGLICIMFAPITLGNSIILMGILWMGDLILIYSGRLPPINCYENIKLTKPGWRYHSKTPGVGGYKSANSNLTASSSIFYAIIIAVIALGMIFFSSRGNGGSSDDYTI